MPRTIDRKYKGKVLFIGHYKDGNSGWATAAKNYILAMDSVGIEVVPRCVRLNQMAAPNVPDRILELEKRDAKGCDVVVQNVLPHFLEYHGEFRKNIAITFLESSNVIASNWHSNLQLMDDVIVSDIGSCRALHNSFGRGKRPGIFDLPIPIEVNRFIAPHDDYEPLPIPELSDKCVFYYIGEFSRRKNLGCLIKAFNTAFSPNDNVALVLKVNKPGVGPQDLRANVLKFCEEVKNALKIPRFFSEIVIADDLSEEQILRLHRTCDVFVSPSHGEAFCIPAIEAIGMGNRVVVTENTGPAKFVNFTNGCTVRATDEPCFGAIDTAFPFLLTGYEDWKEPSVNSLRESLRNEYQIWKSGLPMRHPDISRCTHLKCSFETIGNKLGEIFNAK